jgi:hypothetical protein
MKNLIKGAGYKKSIATLLFALSNVAVFAADNGSTENSSSLGVTAVVGFFAVVLGALLLPAIGHKTHH